MKTKPTTSLALNAELPQGCGDGVRAGGQAHPVHTGIGRRDVRLF